MSFYADSSGTQFYSDITVDGNIINTELQNQLNLKAPLDNPSFTGSITCPTINATTQLQVNGVDINTLYAPVAPTLDSYALTSEVSSFYATKTSVNNKAPINNPTFTGTTSGITKSMIGLGNTSDLIHQYLQPCKRFKFKK